jgi:3-isopropylmalate/(R)-2-methylmalate dehydratase small subunit
MLPIRLSEEEVEEIFQWVWANPGKAIDVDLEKMTVTVGEKVYPFELDEFRRHCLLNGLDNIGLTLQHEQAISAYEKNIPNFLK